MPPPATTTRRGSMCKSVGMGTSSALVPPRSIRGTPWARCGELLRWSVAGLEHAVFERVVDELGPAGEPQLLLDVGAVGLDGPHREVELLADLGVCVPEGDQPQYLSLALRQVVRWACGLRRRGRKGGAQARIKVGLAHRGATHRLDQLGV